MSGDAPVGRPDLFLITETPQRRRQRVDDIREQIAAGRYEVAADVVAAALEAFFSRDFVPEGGDAADPGKAG